MLSDRNSARAYNCSATTEMVQMLQHCELVAVEATVGDRYVSKRCTGSLGVKVDTALPAAVDSVRVLWNVKKLSGGREINLTGIERLPIIFGSTIL